MCLHRRSLLSQRPAFKGETAFAGPASSCCDWRREFYAVMLLTQFLS
jgi:hypothetical protein